MDGNITKCYHDPYNFLSKIITPAGTKLDFNFDLLGRMRNYDASTRESGFNYEGTKRLGDYDNSDDEWKRNHNRFDSRKWSDRFKLFLLK